jgi:hypothetical protein
VSRLEQPRTARTDAAGATAARSPLFSALVGLAGVGVLLQGVWAGMFIREGQDNSDMWVEVHARGAEVTIVLALLAAVVAVLPALAPGAGGGQPRLPRAAGGGVVRRRAGG